MRLLDALRLESAEVVAFVGGGGKSTAMFRLATEIVSAGGRVITTTTTRIFAAQIRLAPHHLALSDSTQSPPNLVAQLEAHPHLLLTGSIDEAAGKAHGIDPALVSDLQSVIHNLQSAILVEADGSRMRPLKAPADHEPVIPECATVVVPVVGADVFGEPLDDVHVHRADLAAKLAGVESGALVTPEVVAALLTHPEGGMKGVPTGARWAPMINKVDTAERLAEGRATAELLLEAQGVETLLAVVQDDDPVRERRSRVAAVVLAAGASTRMRAAGEIKQLLPWGEKPLAAHVIDVALASLADPVVVVVGHQSERVLAALGERAVIPAVNADWESGQSSSVRAGIAALPPGVQAALFLLVDQPMVDLPLIAAIVHEYCKTGAPIVAPRVRGRRANPVLFDRSTWPELVQIRGDTGGRVLFEKYAAQVAWVDWSDDVLIEVNAPSDYERFAPN